MFQKCIDLINIAAEALNQVSHYFSVLKCIYVQFPYRDFIDSHIFYHVIMCVLVSRNSAN
jgi:hypothetical protein